MTLQNSPVFLFDDVRVEPGTFKAFKAGNSIQLEPKELSLLLFLIENRGRLIEKEEILNAIWNGTHVTENALTRGIGKLRKSLGDDPKTPKYIETVHTRGYRFIAELREQNGNGAVAETEARNNGTESPPNGRPELMLAAPSTVTPQPAAPPKQVPSYRAMITVVTIVFGLLLITGIVLWKGRSETLRPQPPIAITSVAVLPFKTSGANAGDEYLGTEIADALTTRLSNSKRLSVRPMTAVLHFAAANESPTIIGSKLKVDYVLYGEIDNLQQHVTTHLIRVQDGAELLAENYDEKFKDIFQLEDSLCTKVLSNLLVNLDHEETQRLRQRYTENQQAYATFLNAHYFMNKATKVDTHKGVDLFRQAIELDPKYAMAYAGLSDCYMRLGRFEVAPAEFVPQSRSAAMKALELDESVAYAHSMLGRIAFQYDWDFSRAEREYARARELNPALVHVWYAAYLMTLNRVAEAEVEYRKFEEFLPFMPANTNLAQYFYLTGQYESAVDLFTRKIEMDPKHPISHEWLGLVYEQQGRSSQAIEEFQKAISLSGGSYGIGALGHIYAALGRKDEARNAIQKLDARSRLSYVSPYEKAVIYSGLGEKDDALKYLQKAYDERSLSGPLLRFDPRLNDLRADRRFQDFLRRVGLSS